MNDGVTLPISHLNGDKTANPTVLARISHEELEQLLHGYRWTPLFAEGSDPALVPISDLSTRLGHLKLIEDRL